MAIRRPFSFEINGVERLNRAKNLDCRRTRTNGSYYRPIGPS
jgi:hypothetical protein